MGKYEVTIIGNDPAGKHLARLAAVNWLRVALVDTAAANADCLEQSPSPDIEILSGSVRFIDRRTIAIGTDLNSRLLTSNVFVIATGLQKHGGRGNTSGFGLEDLEIGIDDRGQLWCDRYGRTWVPGIYGVGEVVGFPRIEPQPEDIVRQIQKFLGSVDVPQGGRC